MIWIIHQQGSVRRALRRLCGADATEAIFAGPSDPLLKTSAAPTHIVMGICGDFEVELDFAQDTLTRFPKTQWLVLADPDDLEEARRLFDVLPAQFQSWPPERNLLLAYLRSASQSGAEPLSARIANQRLEERFLRWFGDLELPGLERARDPRWWSLPVLIHGEPGTGRRLMARALHELQSEAVGSALLQLNCREMDLYDIESCLREGLVQHPLRLTVWLDEVDALDLAQQETLVHWIEDAPPWPCPLRMRWIATSDDVSAYAASCRLMPDLHNALAGLSLYLPPLRDNPERTVRFIKETMRAFRDEHDQSERQLTPDCMSRLEQDAWPGNLRELESLLFRTLAQTDKDPIDALDLCIDGDSSNAVPPRPAPSAQETQAEPAATGELPPTAFLPEPSLRRLLTALIHEIGNPLVTLQTFVDLLPARFEDRNFRTQFSELVPPDTRRIAAVIDQLRRFGAFAAPRQEPVDLASAFDAVLEQRRSAIQEKRLVVLKDFDTNPIRCAGDEEQLHFAFDAVLRTVIELLPERGHLDLVLERCQTQAGIAGASVVLRFRDSEQRLEPDLVDALSVTDNTLALVIAEAVVAAHGGSTKWKRREDGEAVLQFILPRLES